MNAFSQLPDSPRPQIRVPIHLEEAPVFVFAGRGGHRVEIGAIGWQQAERRWEIHGDSRFGFGGGFTQKTWLALLSMFTRRDDGVVVFSRADLCERMRISARSGRNLTEIDVALRQLDALRVYVTGKPLDGPAPDGSRAHPGLGPAGVEHLYSFLSDDGELIEEAPGNQLFLFNPRSGRPRRAQSRRRLGRYVTACLVGDTGRVVPDFVFDLSSAYAVRLVRLLGKRAYRDRVVRVRLSVLGPALPALDVQGRPLSAARTWRAIERALPELYAHGFLTDARLSGDGDTCVITLARAGALSDWEQQVIAELIAATGREGNRAYYARVVRELGADRARACLSDALRLGGTNALAERLGGVIEATRRAAS